VQALLGTLHGCRVADLYAGSGAVGLESLSRGASHALLVESSPRALRVIKENVASLGLPGAEVVGDRVERVVARGADGPYDLVFLDPPYAVGDEVLAGLLGEMARLEWLARDALVAVERATRGGTFAWPEGFEAERDRKYGEATFWYGRFV
jgi:16S rRNA (guanine966-N2)-methyltransferase